MYTCIPQNERIDDHPTSGPLSVPQRGCQASVVQATILDDQPEDNIITFFLESLFVLLLIFFTYYMYIYIYMYIHIHDMYVRSCNII